MRYTRRVLILIAEDDADDQLLIRDALQESGCRNPIRFVNDGEELLEYLRHHGNYTDPALYPKPGLIVLDLNMPRMDGREALGQIKHDRGLRQIPIIILSTSTAQEDIRNAYDLGANSFLGKPGRFDELVALISKFNSFWLDAVELPVSNERFAAASGA